LAIAHYCINEIVVRARRRRFHARSGRPLSPAAVAPSFDLYLKDDTFAPKEPACRKGVVKRQPAQMLASAEESIIFIVDDDEAVRTALNSLFKSVGLNACLFGSAGELLRSKLPDVVSCIVLDVRMPGLSGLDFQAELAMAGISIPIIFMTGHGDIPMSVRAMKAGAVDFLTKPFRDQDMLDAVAKALERDRRRREAKRQLSDLQSRFESLTPREREVMALVATGLMNKQIAGELGVSEITVKIHRGHVMRKMGARSLADLVRMVEALGAKPQKA
jgi:FixJ family two-component response regulator